MPPHNAGNCVAAKPIGRSAARLDDYIILSFYAHVVSARDIALSGIYRSFYAVLGDRIFRLNLGRIWNKWIQKIDDEAEDDDEPQNSWEHRKFAKVFTGT